MDEVVEVVEEVTTQDLRVLVVAGTVGGLLVGAALGYALAKRQLTTKYEELIEQERLEIREFYARKNKKGTYSTPEQAVEQLIPTAVEEAADAMLKYQGQSQPEEDDEPQTTVAVNVFEERQSTYVFDLEEEIKSRRPDKPYVISEEEWGDGQNEYQQITLTYYAGDATLADEKEEHIPDIEAVIGLRNLDRFGHGTEDANVMFVRNEKMGIDFEVARTDGKYAHEVLGLQHSDERLPMRHPNRTKIRVDDD